LISANAPPLVASETTALHMSDGYRAHARYWRGAAAASTGVLYLHGIQSHGGWFEWSASVLAKAGLAVLLPDRRGSGLNDAARGDVVHWSRWVDDVAEQVDWLRSEAGVERVAVLGVSWGGKLAIAATRDRRVSLAGVLLVAPGLFSQVDVGWATKMRIGVALARDPKTMFDIPLSDPALFSDNPAGRAFIADDPHKLTHATARFLWMSSRLDRRLRGLGAGACTSPMTLLLAGRERIIDNVATMAWAERVAPSADLQQFQAASHTLEFEHSVSDYENALQRWARDAVSLRGR
jgi:acylglycerol lipase